MGYTSVGQQPGHTNSRDSVWLVFRVPSDGKGSLTEMDYIDLAIAVIKTQNPHLIRSFLLLSSGFKWLHTLGE